MALTEREKKKIIEEEELRAEVRDGGRENKFDDWFVNTFFNVGTYIAYIALACIIYLVFAR